MPNAVPSPAHVVFVTGPSGAGRTTVINALEDLGFEAIDNLPLRLLPRLLEGPPPDRPLALGIDPRTRDFGAEDLLRAHEKLAADPAYATDLIYVDCEAATLQRRYSETRRRHPLSPDADPAEGIAQEREILAPLRGHASVLIDTTNRTPHDTRAEIGRFFTPDRAPRLVIQLTSFSYRRGLPLGADLVFDCRFLRNPHWDPDLRAQDGRDDGVRAYIAEDARFDAFTDQIEAMLMLLLPAFREEGKSHLTVAFGCTGGRHRSVALTEITAARLADSGWQVSKRHRDVDRDKARAPEDGASAASRGGEA
ncbi:RNase adapter RapZ [Hasllibacter sp. MH4015]|uniref:RNase adapter RapZ n=1 Tax=Hasllibacter sp. MH4015 TaxID=2854029 RepID=UPI001CD7ECC9|nr:RNase adapter RapZ [Hasllibacter sp. MH4015]